MSSKRKEYLKQRKRDNRNERQSNNRTSELRLSGHDPDPLLPLERIVWSIQKYKPCKLFPHQILEGDRKPTPAELEHAQSIAKTFFYFGHGKVVVLDEHNENEIIAIIEFTPLEELSPQQTRDQNIVTTFLHKCKRFVNSISSAPRCWGGKMWVFGWRKCMDVFKLAGLYLNSAKIQAAKADYDSHMRSSPRPSKILGKMFKNLANVAFEQNRDLMKANSIPAFASLHHQDPLGEFDCSPNLTFTTGGFYNPPHKDNEDLQDFAFALFLPTKTADGTLVKPSDNYNITGGAFVFPDYGFGINFSEQKGIVKLVWASRRVRHCTLPAVESSSHTHMALSLQVNKKTANTFRDIENGDIFKRPKNINKKKEDLYVAGHDYCLNPTSYARS
ncbi:hypothetical protein PGTUg99_003934 [Puccinia graminis f. sp. tritici]|uniref:Tet-like 2OG-Fe(II) oxygenase domain-containing protein n=1 Tax=Puccinia graminis f. sp. tritici TaxID=56615 RepID=A0A5B0RFE8_PUCGR|nr:hypothetical protein PGTUg99_003934 [Puccinia graminis f. sp. tritici]